MSRWCHYSFSGRYCRNLWGFLLHVGTLNCTASMSDATRKESGLGSSLKQEMNLGEKENKRIHELKRDSYWIVTRSLLQMT